MVIAKRTVDPLKVNVCAVDGLNLVDDDRAIFETRQQVGVPDKAHIRLSQINFLVSQVLGAARASGWPVGKSVYYHVAAVALPVTPYLRGEVRGFCKQLFDDDMITDQVSGIPEQSHFRRNSALGAGGLVVVPQHELTDTEPVVRFILEQVRHMDER